jgi:hypothetical protein
MGHPPSKPIGTKRLPCLARATRTHARTGNRPPHPRNTRTRTKQCADGRASWPAARPARPHPRPPRPCPAQKVRMEDHHSQHTHHTHSACAKLSIWSPQRRRPPPPGAARGGGALQLLTCSPAGPEALSKAAPLRRAPRPVIISACVHPPLTGVKRVKSRELGAGARAGGGPVAGRAPPSRPARSKAKARV